MRCNPGRAESEAKWGLIRLAVAIALITCVSVAACSMKRMEEVTGSKIDGANAGRLYKAANQRAMLEVAR